MEGNICHTLYKMGEYIVLDEVWDAEFCLGGVLLISASAIPVRQIIILNAQAVILNAQAVILNSQAVILNAQAVILSLSKGGL